MNQFFAWLDRVVTLRWALALTVFEVLLLATVNALDFPLSVPFMERTTGQTYLDMCAFCSGAEVQAKLDAFGEAGRKLQLLLIPTIDVAIPFLSFAFGSAALTLGLRGRASPWVRPIRLLPFAALVLDLAENAGIVALVTAYPAHLDGLAALVGWLSGLKFSFYGAMVLAIVAVSIARPGARAGRARPGLASPTTRGKRP